MSSLGPRESIAKSLAQKFDRVEMRMDFGPLEFWFLNSKFFDKN